MEPRKKGKYEPNRIEGGGFVPIPHVVIRSEGFGKLSAHAVKLLTDLLSQYRGNNNGDLSAPYSTMHKKRGWRSKGTLSRAIKELLASGFIEISRQGGRHKCTLYATTFFAIDECNGKIDIRATSKPTSLWRANEPLPSIAQLQREKIAREDALLSEMIIKRTLRENATPYENQRTTTGPYTG